MIVFRCTNDHIHATFSQAANCYRAGEVTPQPVEEVRQDVRTEADAALVSHLKAAHHLPECFALVEGKSWHDVHTHLHEVQEGRR